MTERPILFSGAMVRAILAGTKTQTRRIVKPRHDWTMDERDDGAPWPFFEHYVHAEPEPVPVQCPYGASGDRLWVKETHQLVWIDERPGDIKTGDGMRVVYTATTEPEELCDVNADSEEMVTTKRCRPSIFMPRWASRITLEITDVRVERVQSISDADARAEGLRCLSKDGGITYKHGIPDRDGLPGTDDDGWPWHEWEVDPRAAYRKLWESISGAESWASNDCVWVVSFRMVE